MENINQLSMGCTGTPGCQGTTGCAGTPGLKVDLNSDDLRRQKNLHRYFRGKRLAIKHNIDFNEQVFLLRVVLSDEEVLTDEKMVEMLKDSNIKIE